METIKLDLIPSGKMPSLHASQYDDGREHGIDLFENGIAYKLDGTETLTINERKGDDCICSLDIENTFADKTYVEFASTLQMCAVAGANICELVIKRGSVTLGTLNFILEIEPSPTEGGIESESEISNLERQITEITEQVIGDDYYTAEETDEAIATAIEGKADKTYVDEQANLKMDKANPTGTGSFSLNRKAFSTVGNRSVTVGDSNEASGKNSFAEGQGTKASGSDSHAEGYHTVASNNRTHAEGYYTQANGTQSHAEGYYSEASGASSHAEGTRTIANHKSQHVFGEFNIPDDSTATADNKGNYVEIVGNGTGNNARSNARTLDWSGNETLAGDVIINGNKSLTSEITRLDGRIDNLPAPMIFKGTLGVGGTIQTLPTASASNEGYTYKVITDGTYAGQTAKVGDVFTSNGSSWVLIPSGDEDNDTWRAIKVEGVEVLGNGISSGAVDFVGSDNIEVDFDSDGNKVGVKTKNIYTKAEVNEIVAEAIYDVLPSEVASGSVANFETDLALPLKSLEVDVNAVQSGSGDPSPNNVRPISGWDKIIVSRTGKNLFTSLGTLNAYITGLGTVANGPNDRVVICAAKPSTQYTISFTRSVITGTDDWQVGEYTDIPVMGSTGNRLIGTTMSSGVTSATITTGATTNYLAIKIANVTKTNLDATLATLQIEFGSTATDYEPYNGNVSTIPLGQTVYGGSINLTTGLLRITKGFIEFDGSADETWQRHSSGSASNFAMKISLVHAFVSTNANISSNYLTAIPSSATWGNYDNWISSSSGGVLNTGIQSITDVAMWRTYLASNPLEVRYELATPIEIQLTPQEIEAIVGTNNIYANTGDTSVVFKDSVNGYVEKKIASVQALALNT